VTRSEKSLRLTAAETQPDRDQAPRKPTGKLRDAFVGARDPLRLVLDLLADLVEVVEALVGHVQKLGVFADALLARERLLRRGCIGRGQWREVDELKNERSAGHDAAATRQEVAADNVLMPALSPHDGAWSELTSRTELFPLLCDPTDTIWGRSTLSPRALATSATE
jgi:hypothetical protein